MNIQIKKSDTRAATRARLMHVFNALLLEGEAPRPKVAQIIAEANISRSTFYDYFDGVEALLNESLAGLLQGMADALVKFSDTQQLNWFFEHIWENKALAREMLTGPRSEQVEALLARKIEEQLPDRTNKRLMAILVAGTVIAALGNWVTGRVSGSSDRISRNVETSVTAMLAANPEKGSDA